jgi:hypothetical protein
LTTHIRGSNNISSDAAISAQTTRKPFKGSTGNDVKTTGKGIATHRLVHGTLVCKAMVMVQ